MKVIAHILFIILCGSLFYPAMTFPDEKKEAVVKAAFMLKITHFIKWPNSTATHLNKSKFTICLNRSTQLNDILSEWAHSGLIKNKPVNIKNLEYDANKLAMCDMLYISSNEKLIFLLKQAKRNHTLTISDIPGNAKRGVLVNFINEKEKLRFEINLNAAKKVGFKINPRLLKLSTIVNSDEVKE